MGIHAQTEINGVAYSFDEEKKTATVTGVDQFYSGDIVIPETVNHNGNVYGVSKIASHAFSFTYGIKKVVIPNSVTRIADSAFGSCHGLERISIPESVKEIEHHTFESCENLTAVTLPSSLESIDLGAFSGCRSLTTIKLPESLNYIGSQAFYGCKKLQSIEIPENVTKISSATFQDCYSLKNVKLPESLVEIEDQAFYYCSVLDEIVIPSSVRTMGKSIFVGSGLKVVNNYSPAPQIISSNENPNIIELHVPVGFKEVYQSAAFWGKYNIIDDLESPYVALKSDVFIFALDTNTQEAMLLGNGGKCSGDVVIPSSVDYKGDNYKVTSLFDKAFYGCDELVSVTIPENIKVLGRDVFSGCPKLYKYYFLSRTAPTYEGLLFEGKYSGEVEIHIPTGYVDEYQSSFWSYNPIDDIPSNFIKTDIKTLRYYLNTDNGNAQLINNGVEMQGDVEVPSVVSYQNRDYTVTSIRYAAFSGAYLNSLTIPATVTEICEGAFDLADVEKLYNMSAVPQAIGDERLSCSEFHIPLGHKRDYLKAYYWARYPIIDDIINDNVVKVEDNGFVYYIDPSINFVKLIGGKSQFTGNVVIPEKVTYKGITYDVKMIGREAFAGCNNVTSLTIPRCVEDIDEDAFAECYKIKDVTNYAFIPQLLNGNVFAQYGNLHVAKDCGRIYSKCREWESFTIIEDIPNDEFVKVEDGSLTYYVNRITKTAHFGNGNTQYKGEIVIAPSVVYEDEIYPVTSIIQGTITNTKVTSVSIPASVTDVDYGVFSWCSSLKTVTSYSRMPQTVYYQKYDRNAFCVLYVPAGSKDVYESTPFWYGFEVKELEDVEDALSAKTVTDLIASIGTPEYTADYKAKMAAARAAYAALSKEQQAWVPNFILLVKAEKGYEKLENSTDIIDVNAFRDNRNVVKYMENGKVLIVKDGKKFNIVGLQQ